jgi:Zn-dependent M28 family amino/carboxypeptidase
LRELDTQRHRLRVLAKFLLNVACNVIDEKWPLFCARTKTFEVTIMFWKTEKLSRQTRWWLSGAAAAITLGIAACGGGGDSAPATVASSGAPIGTADSSTDTVVDAVAEDALIMKALDDITEMPKDESDRLCKDRNNSTFKKLLDCVTLDGVREHQAKLRDIALANGGTRVSGTKGYNDSADYAEKIFRSAGYTVTRQTFEFQGFIELPGTILKQISPTPTAVIDTNILSYSGSGSVTATVSVVPSAIGCNTADFANFPKGNIALISRGSCSFAIKATNAQSAGASAVVIYNNAAGELNGTLGAEFKLNIAVTGILQTVGQQLSTIPGLVLSVAASTVRGTVTTSNVIAESKEGNANNVVMIGAHLDSVSKGGGINDNGSGSAAVLEVAKQMGKVKPINRVRFALWGAEESGLVGSTRYVASLSDEDKGKIGLYLNFDMIGSPNHVFFVYDGDNSDGVGAGAGPAGSRGIEKAFETYYNKRGVSFKGTDFDGRSDYKPFIDAGIPAGGLFTGAESTKTVAEAEVWGGVVGQAYDPCYHEACDTFANVNLFSLDVNADAVAYTALQFAMTTKEINGIRGKDPAPNINKRSASEKVTPAIPDWKEYPARSAS